MLASMALIFAMPLHDPPHTIDPALLTVAEASDFAATASSDEVLALLERLRERSPHMRVGEMGRTVEDRPIPLIFLADPPVASIAEARAAGDAGGRPVVFILANIHAGEVEGKAACLMLAREIGLAPQHPLLRDLIIVLAPNYNADGNDRFDAVEKKRPGQAGPARVGTRQNAQGIDLNRDYIALAAPESRALVKLLNELDPDITIDLHTTNGSRHRYVLTYEAPLNPAGHQAPIAFVRQRLLPEVAQRIKQSTGWDMWHYGNFNREHTVWETYSALPRFGGNYQGLRGQMSVLSEAYSHAPFKERVLATRAFAHEIMRFVAEHRDEVIEISGSTRRETAAMGENPQPHDVVGIRHRVAAFDAPAVVLGYELERGEGGRLRPGVAPRDHQVVHLGRFEPTLSVSRPWAYILPPAMSAAADHLRRHGIDVRVLERGGEASVQVYTITTIERGERSYFGPGTVLATATAASERRAVPPGSYLVPVGQPLGTLAVYVLEPMSDDGMVTWYLLGDAVAEGREYPIWRVQRSDDLREAR
jgi:dipeptidyl-peptidase 4